MDDDIGRAQRAKHGSPFLNTQQAAHYLGFAPRTLEDMRARGDGPRFRKHARHVRYHVHDLDAWSDAQAREKSHD